MLRVEGLVVEVSGKRILKGVDLKVEDGETHVLLGPNGGGKTTLLMSILGMPRFRVVEGAIFFDSTDITNMPIDERARLGIGLAFQRPPAVRGIKTGELVRMCLRNGGESADFDAITDRLNMRGMLDRDVNLDLSGGEMKRSELLQLLALQPKLALFDEPESGVDLDNIAIVGNAISDLIKGDRATDGRRTGLIVTHTGHILDYVNADKGHVLMDGGIVCWGNPRDLFDDIREYGYEGCLRCPRCQEE